MYRGVSHLPLPLLPLLALPTYAVAFADLLAEVVAVLQHLATTATGSR